MFSAGYARFDITPVLGHPIDGYYKERYAEGVLDPLEVCALAFDCDGEKALIISLDVCGNDTELMTEWRKAMEEKLGIAADAVYITLTHTHTSGALRIRNDHPGVPAYRSFVGARVMEAAAAALEDHRPARMGWGIGKAPNISFIRRFRMKDGSVQTNPGVNNPDIVAPIGEIDDNVYVMRLDREGADTLILVNFADHPDVVGGSRISADWPGMTRRQLELSLPGTRAIVVNGAQGDVNHVNVHPTGGYGNDLVHDFDDVDRGYGHARFMARVITGGVLQIYDKVLYRQVDRLTYASRAITVPSNMPSPEDMPRACEYERLHRAGKDSEIPFRGMMLTTVVAEAERMISLEHGPESFELVLSGLRIGPVAFIGIPGEPFNGVGKGIRDTEDWDMVITTCLTNGEEGYFPMKDAYEEGGYEARSSIFKAGVAEILIDEGKALLDELK